MEKIIVYSKPASPVAEAYRSLFLNIAAKQGNKKVIEVVGVSTTNNSSIVVANLAVTAAQAGKNVILVDCNLRTPRQHEIFDIMNRGVTDILLSGEDVHKFVQSTAQPNLWLLPSGVAESNPTELLQNSAMCYLLNSLREEYDLILLDVPSAGETIDAVILGTEADCVILMVTSDKDKVEQAQKVKEVLTSAGVTILGCIIEKNDLL